MYITQQTLRTVYPNTGFEYMSVLVRIICSRNKTQEMFHLDMRITFLCYQVPCSLTIGLINSNIQQNTKVYSKGGWSYILMLRQYRPYLLVFIAMNCMVVISFSKSLYIIMVQYFIYDYESPTLCFENFQYTYTLFL